MSNNKQSMKLYTEEQVRNMLRATCAYTPTQIDSLIQTITPIELQSDDETEEEARKQWVNVHRTGMLGFIEGAKWMRDKIQGGNK